MSWGAPYGGRVQRIDLPSADLLAVSLYRPDEKEVLVVRIGDRASVALVAERPKGEPATGFVRKLRKELGGAHLLGAFQRGPRTVELELRRGGEVSRVVAEAGPRGAGFLYVAPSGRIATATTHRALRERGLRAGGQYAPLDDAAERTLVSAAALRTGSAASRHDPRADKAKAGRVALDKALRRALRKADRKVQAIEGDAARARQAPELRRQAQMIQANFGTLAPGAASLTAMDWEAEPPEERSVDLDPSKPARVQAEALFRRARRVERGADIAATHLRIAEVRRDALRALTTRAASEPLGELLEACRELGVRLGGGQPSAASRRGATGRTPYRSFRASDGRSLWVGRSAADNDTLTVRLARPQDLWFHARGRTGSHVIVRLTKGEVLPQEVRLDAATLAAHFSDAAGEALVDIQYTPRRFLRKPRGSAVGAVMVDRERVLMLRLEPERLRRLLDAEEPG